MGGNYMNNIPKIIHYCWFGSSDYSEKIKKCIKSWEEKLQGYRIVLWNEKNFNVNENRFTKQAFDNKKFAFVSDYVRLWALEKYGGIYLDVDVEVIKPFDDVLDQSLIIALDDLGDVTGAFIAAKKNHPFIIMMREKYDNMSFILPDGSLNMVVNNIWIQEELVKYGYKRVNKKQMLSSEIMVFPNEYFHAKSLISGKIHQTENTHCIHHHTLLWVSKKTKIIRFIRMRIMVPILGEQKYLKLIRRMKR